MIFLEVSQIWEATATKRISYRNVAHYFSAMYRSRWYCCTFLR